MLGFQFDRISTAALPRNVVIEDVIVGNLKLECKGMGIPFGVESDALDQSHDVIVGEAIVATAYAIRSTGFADWRIVDGELQVVFDGAGFDCFED